MKRILILALVALTFASCGPTNNVAKEARKTLKGTWSLNAITYNTPGKFDVTLFEDVKASCLEGSTWRFIPNNNFGNYEILKGDCNPGKRYFVWTIPKGDDTTTSYDILLKPTDEKMKSTMNNAGFRLNLDYVADDLLQIKQTVMVDGKPFVITMAFSPIQ